MKLFWTPASPFVRKVMLAAIELGLRDRLEIVPTYWPHAWGTRTVAFDTAFVAANPIGRIPTLVTDDGTAIPESNWICLYLESLGSPGWLLPLQGKARWQTIRTLAIADGAIEAMIARRAESLRPAHELSKDFLDKQRDRTARCLDALEADADALDGPLTLAQISGGAACGYMDFRYPEDRWREGRPRLTRWFKQFVQRPSMIATAPAETPQRPPAGSA